MHDRENVAAPEGVANGGDVGDVALNELAVADRLPVSCRQIIEDHDPVAGAAQGLGGVAPDVPRAAGNQHAERLSGQWRNR